MKNASTGKEVKQFLGRLKRAGNRVAWPESDDPLEHLMTAVLAEGGNPAKARSALTRLLAQVVDLNELRVSTPRELAAIIEKEMPNSLKRCTRLVRVLNAIYEKQNVVTLEGLKARGKREARAYLDGLDGMTPYVAAATMLYGLGELAVPVDSGMLAVLKGEHIVDEAADTAAAQAFLERHLTVQDAKAFTVLLQRQASLKRPRAADKKKAAGQA